MRPRPPILALLALLLAASPLCCTRERTAVGDQGVTDQAGETPPDQKGVQVDSGPLSWSLEVTAATHQKIEAMAMTYSEGAFTLIWEEIPEGSQQRFLTLARVSIGGALLMAPTHITSLGFKITALYLFPVPGGFVLWYREKVQESGIYALNFNAEGAIQNEREVIKGTRSQYYYGSLGVAFSGESFGLLYEKYIKPAGTSYYQVHFSRVDLALQEMEEPRVLSPKDRHQSFPYLLWRDGTSGQGVFTALWEEVDTGHVAFIDGADGQTIEGPRALFSSKLPQIGPRGITLDEHASLIWWTTETITHQKAFLRLEGFEPGLTAPAAPLPHNRHESLDIALGVFGPRVLIVWQSNHNSALSQIVYSELDVAKLDQPLIPTVLSDPRYYFSSPLVAGSPAGFGVLFKGTVEGSKHLYFRMIP